MRKLCSKGVPAIRDQDIKSLSMSPGAVQHQGSFLCVALVDTQSQSKDRYEVEVTPMTEKIKEQSKADTRPEQG